MCGISGILQLNGDAVDPALISAMNGTLVHRGPDGAGEYVSGPIALGHRRLSIIDLDGGRQPLTNEDGTVHVTFNGEIYNYVELRHILKNLGHHFATESDTEVIVHAYEQWGDDCVSRFNGMFAFGIWDARRRRLLIARDHLGVKPLYYYAANDRIAFASEIKALLKIPACPRDIDPNALAALFTFRYVPSPNTLFWGIKKLPPAHTLTVQNGVVRTARYWNPPSNVRRKYREADLICEYRTLLEDAVRIQLRSDVPLGLFLSSGVDSGALLALMSKHSSRVRTFTIGFSGGESTNEIEDAQELARAFGAEHRYRVIGPTDYMQYYTRYMRDIEEPVGNETAAAFYFVAQLARSEVKVALTGQGADEPWAGYDRHKGIRLSEYYSRIPRPIARAISNIAERVPGRFERMRRGTGALHEGDLMTRFTKVYSFFSADLKAELFNHSPLSGVDHRKYGERAALAHLQKDVAHLDPVSQMLYIDTRASLPDDLLMVGDKTSMANSLEARVPFLDVRLIEFVESLPANLKLRGLTGKYLHKRAIEQWLPKHIVHRKKKGFANPVEHWFRSSMKPFIEDALLGQGALTATYFDRTCVRRMIDADHSGRQQYRRHLYLLLSVELWQRSLGAL